jgi:hypothetical protein
MRLLLPQRDNTKILGKPSIGLLTIWRSLLAFNLTEEVILIIILCKRQYRMLKLNSIWWAKSQSSIKHENRMGGTTSWLQGSHLISRLDLPLPSPWLSIMIFQFSMQIQATIWPIDPSLSDTLRTNFFSRETF